MIAGYANFLAIAERGRWEPAAIDLHADAAAWPHLEPQLRERLETLVAGFCLGEAQVASELAPFAVAAPDPDVAACFAAQAADERRHAAFFARVAGEVLGGASSARLDPAFAALFERRLPAVAAALADGEADLGDAVGLYHMVLEGVVFTAGQLALLELVEDAPLPGVREGVERVTRDERWHVGFGARCLQDARVPAATTERILREGEAAVAVWGETIADADRTARVLAIHRRRLRAAGLTPSGRAPAARAG